MEKKYNQGAIVEQPIKTGMNELFNIFSPPPHLV